VCVVADLCARKGCMRASNLVGKAVSDLGLDEAGIAIGLSID
jgi:hypothetical protein